MRACLSTCFGVGARLEMRKVDRGGLAGIKVDVVTDEQGTEKQGAREQGSERAEPTHSHSHSHPHEPHDHEHHSHEHEHSEHAPHRSLSTILAIIQAAPLKETVKQRASHAFQLLGEAEAAIHSIPIEKVHFHEVGAVDTIVDIVCAAAGCETLNVDRWLASPLNVGSGTVKCQHGTLPVPAPATLSLLGDAPVYAAGPPMERVTPTGAALLRMLDVRYGPLPAMRVATRHARRAELAAAAGGRNGGRGGGPQPDHRADRGA